MANILTRIKQKIRNGSYYVLRHCLDALEDENFGELDARKAILSANECVKLTEDESHVRYEIIGWARDGRPLTVVVTVYRGTVILKTAYER